MTPINNPCGDQNQPHLKARRQLVPPGWAFRLGIVLEVVMRIALQIEIRRNSFSHLAHGRAIVSRQVELGWRSQAVPGGAVFSKIFSKLLP